MTSSLSVDRRGSQRPRFALIPSYKSTSGPEFAALADIAGINLDPWQTYVLDSALAENPDGKWAARNVGLWVPRQNGKSELLPILALGYLLLAGSKLVLLSAHQVKTAKEILLRLLSIIESTPEIAERIDSIRHTNGEQQITVKGGGRIRLVARSRSSIRGFSADVILLDEAQELSESEMAALLPTISAQANPHIWFLGTPPDPDSEAWIYNLRAEALKGAERLCFLDWGADLDLKKPSDLARLDDVDLLYQTNPALGIRDMTLEAVRAERVLLGDVRYAYERLGVWPPRSLSGSTISLEQWHLLADFQSKRDRGSGCAIGVDRSPIGDYASISVYGIRQDGIGHLQLVDYRPGVDWVAARLQEWIKDLKPCAVAMGKGTFESLEADLKKVGITKPKDPKKPRRGDLIVTQGSDMSAATAQFLDAVNQKTFRHVPVDQLDQAVKGAKVRTAHDGVAWSRKDANADISPLVSATLARYAYETYQTSVPDYDITQSLIFVPFK